MPIIKIMIYINLFNSVKEPTVKATIPITTCFEIVKNGGEKKHLIEEAQFALLMEKDRDRYDDIKVTLPCVNYSFLFDGYRKGKNIINPTGLIALDIDGNTTLPKSNYICASYHSLSKTGRLILIKTNNLNASNYKYNYQLLAEEIGVNPDFNAGKITQPFVLSYDSSIYINDTSKVWIAKEPKKTHFIPEKKERVIGNGLGSSKKRFSNIDDFISSVDFDGEALYDNKEMFGVASIFVPRNGIPEGLRNRSLIGIGYQFRALNPTVTFYDVYNILEDVNKKHCQPRVYNVELRKIVESIMKTKREDLVLTPNEIKRFLFNPDYDLTTKEKQSLVMTTLNRGKSEKSKKDIEETIKAWDFVTNGKITQKKLAKISKKNIKTVKKYYPIFKQEIKRLNKEFAENKRPPP